MYTSPDLLFVDSTKSIVAWAKKSTMERIIYSDGSKLHYADFILTQRQALPFVNTVFRNHKRTSKMFFHLE